MTDVSATGSSSLARGSAAKKLVLVVVDAQTTLATAENAQIEGRVRYRLALANLQTLTGKL